jgi:mRNA interferase HigB
MRVIAISTLRGFWEKYPDSEQELKTWYKKIKNAQYQTPNDVIEDTPTADTVKNNRVSSCIEIVYIIL